MAATSSTSSSDSPGTTPKAASRAPWAFLLAIAIVIAFELFLRTRDPRSLIAYPVLPASADQTVTYKAVREYVAVDGPAEVALIGSSQMREGVSMPVLIDEIEKNAGRPVSVANYATRGARADGMQAVVQYLLNQPRKPKLIVIGLSVRDLRTKEIDLPRMAVFWDVADWWRESSKTLGWRATDVLPIVLRNEAGKAIYTLRFRDQLAIDLAKPFERFGVPVARDTNPIIGEVTYQHTGRRGLRKVSEVRLSPRRMLSNARISYDYPAGPKPSEPMTLRLKAMIEQIEAAGVKAMIVEMSVADLLKNDLVRVGQAQWFNRSVTTLTQHSPVRFIPAATQPVQLGPDYFSDLQHHNRRGAELFSQWLAAEVAGELK